jgi:hypothetical protein
MTGAFPGGHMQRRAFITLIGATTLKGDKENPLGP